MHGAWCSVGASGDKNDRDVIFSSLFCPSTASRYDELPATCVLFFFCIFIVGFFFSCVALPRLGVITGNLSIEVVLLHVVDCPV